MLYITYISIDIISTFREYKEKSVYYYNLGLVLDKDYIIDMFVWSC